GSVPELGSHTTLAGKSPFTKGPGPSPQSAGPGFLPSLSHVEKSQKKVEAADFLPFSFRYRFPSRGGDSYETQKGHGSICGRLSHGDRFRLRRIVAQRNPRRSRPRR